MGTSASHPGTGPRAPLVPEWADGGGPDPLPDPEKARFRAFRGQLGKFVKTGSGDHLNSALRHFASTAMGGSAAGARRFGAMARAGSTMFGALNASGGLPLALERAGVNLDALHGAPIGVVIDAIVRAFTPENGDADKIEAALREALEQALDGKSDFDVENFQGFDDTTYVDMITNYIESCIVEQIMSEGKGSFDKAASGPEQMAREKQLRAVVAEVVETSMIPLAEAGIRNMNQTQLERLQLQCIEKVLRSWEN